MEMHFHGSRAGYLRTGCQPGLLRPPLLSHSRFLAVRTPKGEDARDYSGVPVLKKVTNPVHEGFCCPKTQLQTLTSGIRFSTHEWGWGVDTDTQRMPSKEL